MSPRPAISEEELHAFIDGELDPARRNAVERLLEEDAALAERVVKFREDKRRLASIYATLLERPLPPSWERLIRQDRPSYVRRREFSVLTAIAASLVIVIGGVWLAHSPGRLPQTRSLVSEALAARNGDLHPDAISSGDMFSASRQVSAALAMKAKAPVLARMGYRLASIRSYDTVAKERSVELTYADSRGREVTLYVSRSVGTPRFDQYESGGVRICIWQDDIVGMVMVGHLSAAEMQRLATLAYDGLTA